MRPIKRILVPVRNPSARSLPAVDKAAQLATAFGAKLELFQDIADPIAVDAWHGPGNAMAHLRRQAIEGLERLAAPLRKRGLAVSIAAVWDYPPFESILRRAVAIGADLIVAPRRDRHRLPTLLGYTDWELLRLSPMPVLLVKTPTPYRRPTVLAAIDPTHAHAKPSALDRRILQYGAQVSGALRGALHVVHAYVPRPLPPTITFDAERRKQLLAGDEREARETFDEALAKTTIPASRRHLVRGGPVAAIPATARKTGSAIVVIGAVSRSALKRLFIGNTAESVMDELRCDLLVVKPGKFALKAGRARRGPKFVSTALPL
ncbi:MAG: universal stress protein [Steroidobacteraceae bacterium]